MDEYVKPQKRPRVGNKRYYSVSLQVESWYYDRRCKAKKIHEATYHTTDGTTYHITGGTSRPFESLTRGLKGFFSNAQRQGGRHVAAEASVAFRVRLTAASVRAEHVQHLPESSGRRAWYGGE